MWKGSQPHHTAPGAAATPKTLAPFSPGLRASATSGPPAAMPRARVRVLEGTGLGQGARGGQRGEGTEGRTAAGAGGACLRRSSGSFLGPGGGLQPGQGAGAWRGFSPPAAAAPGSPPPESLEAPRPLEQEVEPSPRRPGAQEGKFHGAAVATAGARGGRLQSAWG